MNDRVACAISPWIDARECRTMIYWTAGKVVLT